MAPRPGAEYRDPRRRQLLRLHARGTVPARDPRPRARRDGGRDYWLSALLACTSGRGNSVEEALAYLRAAATADGTRPEGTIFYMRNADVRSTTREWAFAAACDRLKALGVRAEIREGVLPQKEPAVAGAMIGAAGLAWQDSGSTILPGAICEHLTSCGGMMCEYDGQTPLTIAMALPGATALAVRHHGRGIARLAGSGGVLTIDPRCLGQGPVTLLPVATMAGKNGKLREVHGEAVRLTIVPPAPLAPAEMASGVTLDIRFGGTGTQRLAAPRFKCRPPA